MLSVLFSKLFFLGQIFVSYNIGRGHAAEAVDTIRVIASVLKPLRGGGGGGGQAGKAPAKNSQFRTL